MTALLTCSLLAACGGGGGGGTGGGSGTVPTPTPTSGAVNPRAVIRSDAQGILAAGKVLSGGGYNAGGSPLGAMAVVRRVRARRGTLASCNSLGSLGSNTVTDTTDAQGNDTQTYTDFYDSNCQQVERVAVLVYPKGSSISGGNVNGTTTEYDHSAAVTGYSTWQSTFNSSTMTVQTQDAKTVGGAIVGRSGATCTYTGTSTETCGQASFATVGGTTTGLIGVHQRVVRSERAELCRDGAGQRHDIQRRRAHPRPAGVGNGMGTERRHATGLDHGFRQQHL